MKHVIYGLCEPETEFVRYVGYRHIHGKQTLERRLWEHINEAKKKNGTHKLHWLRKLLSEHMEPCIVVLEEVTAENWKARESYWIATLRASNNLTNSTDGGEGLVNPSQDVRDRISQKVSGLLQGNKRRLGIPHTNELKQKLSESLVEAWKTNPNFRNRKPPTWTPESRERLRANAGKVFSEEHKQRISESLKKVSSRLSKGAAGSRWITNDIETKRLPSGLPIPDGWRFGNPLTASRNKTLVISEKGREKLAAFRRGKKMSEETKARIAETMRRVRAEKSWSTKSNAASHVA